MQMDSVVVFILAMMVAFLIYFVRKMVTGRSSETTTKDWLLYFLIAPLMIAAFLGSFFYAESKGIEEEVTVKWMDILGRARLASRCPFYCFAKTSLAEGKLLLADGSGRPSRNGCGVLLDEPNVWTDNNPTVTGFSRVRSDVQN